MSGLQAIVSFRPLCCCGKTRGISRVTGMACGGTLNQ